MSKPDETGNCPHCGVSWDQGPIVDWLRSSTPCIGMTEDQLRAYVYSLYGNADAHYSRLIQVNGQTVNWWICPDCKTRFGKFS